MAESTFDRLAGQLPPPTDTTKKRRTWMAVAAAVAAGALGVAAGAGHDRIVAALDQQAVEAPVPAFHELPDLTVNLRPTATVKLMKIGLTLKVQSDRLEELKAHQPALIDALTAYLRQLDEHDLEGTAGLDSLRAEIARRVHLMTEPVPVEDVLLRTLILQ